MLAIGGARRFIDDLRRRCHQAPAVARERLFVFIAVILIVLFRSAMFVFQTSFAFDSDQAVFGLMAKHLSEGRAFPLFMYGKNHILAVEAWLAAPMFLLFGVSAAALKLPLLAFNVAAGLLLVSLLGREVGLRPMAALIASLFFVLAPLGTAAKLLEPIGGNVEPFVYVLVLWLTRRRPVWFGLVFGLGFLHREFTIYGVIALILVEIANGSCRSREDWRSRLAAFRVAVEVWLVVQLLRPLASAAGPGTTMADIRTPSNNLLELAGRFCLDLSTLPGGLQRLVTVHWAQLFGTEVLPAFTFGLESQTRQGLSGSGFVLGAAALLMLVRIGMHARADAGWWRRYSFCIYLMLVGGFSAGAFVIGRCGSPNPLRYDLLSLLGAVGLVAWFLAVERSGWYRALAVTVVIGWAAVSAVGHGRVWLEYARHPPIAAKTLIIGHLEARGIKYATSDYWIAYYVTFLTNERIIVASDDVQWIPDYARQVDEHRAQAIRISRTPCPLGRQVIEGVYFCELD